MPRFMVPEFGQKVNLEFLVDATASEARFASVYPGGGVVSISRDRLPPADQRLIWPEAQVAPVVEWPGRDLMEPGDRVDVAVVDDFAGLLPPATWTDDLLQVGEALDCEGPGGAVRYLTFRRDPEGWVYAGKLPLGVIR